MIASLASDQILRRFDNLETGELTLTTPDGKTRVFQGKKPGSKAVLKLHDWRVVSNLASRGNIGLADDYRFGHWDTDDLQNLVLLGLQNKGALRQMISGNSIFRRLSALSYLLRMNTLKGSKKNIHAHYDLGNDFYKLWLDETMTYSSAIYKHPHDTLTQAQHQKYDRIIDELDTSSGNLLEIGCGWAGFADRALQRGDYSIKGITLSEEQHRYGQQRLGNTANIALEDYRLQDGLYDRIVSIEMFEAVGERFWPQYFGKVRSLLKSNGKAIIQTITMNERDFPAYRQGGDFIRSYIFPGGMLPSPSAFRKSAASAGLRAQNEFFFGQDYARTLTEWLHAFDQKKDDVKNLGFDDSFIRLWRFYLAACAAAFRSGHINVMQTELRHA